MDTVQRVIVNRRAGKCDACRATVEESLGYAVLTERWLLFHNSDKCLPAVAQAKVAQIRQAPGRKLTADGFVFTPREPDNLPLLRAFPGARFRKPDDGREPAVDQMCWQVSLAGADRPRVLELADKLKLDVAETLRTWDRAEHIKRTLAWAEGMGAYPFQVEGVEYIASHDVCLLGDDMGLGKTIQALLAAPSIEAGFGILVVCPASLKYNWLREARKWAPDYESEVLSGRTSFRLPNSGECLIANPEILPGWLAPVKTGEKSARGRDKLDVVCQDEQRVLAATTYLIIDELHRYKNHEAQRTQRMEGLMRLVGYAVGMSGTPLLNRPFDLWGVLSVLGLQYEVFGSFDNFVKLFKGRKNPWGGWDWGTPSPEVPERLRRVMLRRTKEQVLPDLPRKSRQFIQCDVTQGDIARALDVIGAEFSEALAADILSMPMFERMSEIRAALSQAMLPAALDIIETYEDAGEPLVVFCPHRGPVEELGRREGWAQISGGVSALRRDDIVADFQAGKLKGIALTIGAGGVGLTLTRASNELFIGREWVPSDNLQAEDRCCRIGATADKINVRILEANHPLIQRVSELLEWKIALIEAAIEAEAKVAIASHTSVLPAVQAEEAADYAMRAAEVTAQDAAVRRAQEIAERRVAADKVQAWAARKCGTSLEPLPAGVVDQLMAGLAYMVSACDGAVTKDDVGFNKVDAAYAHWIAFVDWRDNVSAQHLVRHMLRGYPRQLKGSYPLIWRG